MIMAQKGSQGYRQPAHELPGRKSLERSESSEKTRGTVLSLLSHLQDGPRSPAPLRPQTRSQGGLRLRGAEPQHSPCGSWVLPQTYPSG